MTSLDPGDTAIVVLCPELDERIQRWHVDERTPGIPAHVTLMYPFLPLDQVTDHDLRMLAEVFALEAVTQISFTRTGRFPGVLYLAPDDDGRFRRLTGDLVDLWPEHAPYGGAFDDVIPHLTIAHGLTEDELDAIDRELVPHLPVSTIVGDAWLMTFDGDEWSCEARFAFGAAGR